MGTESTAAHAIPFENLGATVSRVQVPSLKDQMTMALPNFSLMA